MKASSIILLLFFAFGLIELSAVSPGDSRRYQSNPSADKDYLFPGTGFFKKNRDPIDSEQAKEWFLTAESKEKSGDLGKALDLYENFAKRRSDATLSRNNELVQIGPESLYRASMIREKRGDWQKSFEHMKLIAEAYTEYDFERVAESLMRIAERLAKEKLPRKWGFVPRFRSGNKDRMRLDQIAGLARGPKFAPRALMALAEIAEKDNKEDESIDAWSTFTPITIFARKRIFSWPKFMKSAYPALLMIKVPHSKRLISTKIILFYIPSLHQEVSMRRKRIIKIA
jgi:hypothetical protein